MKAPAALSWPCRARAWRAFLGLLIALLCAACRTDIALVDRDYGAELRHRGRIAHVRSARTPIAQRDHGYRFVLDLVLENDTAEVWPVRASDFAVRSLAKPGEAEGLSPAIDMPAETVLISVPAREDAEIRVPVRIDSAQPTTVIDLERMPLELTLTQDGTQLVRRRVVAGSYSQLGQVARVVFLATAGLVLLSLL